MSGERTTVRLRCGPYLGRGELEEGHTELTRDRVRQERLAAAGRAVQQNATRCVLAPQRPASQCCVRECVG